MFKIFGAKKLPCAKRKNLFTQGGTPTTQLSAAGMLVSVPNFDL